MSIAERRSQRSLHVEFACDADCVTWCCSFGQRWKSYSSGCALGGSSGITAMPPEADTYVKTGGSASPSFLETTLSIFTREAVDLLCLLTAACSGCPKFEGGRNARSPIAESTCGSPGKSITQAHPASPPDVIKNTKLSRGKFRHDIAVKSPAYINFRHSTGVKSTGLKGYVESRRIERQSKSQQK